MRQRLADATPQQRDRLEVMAREFGAGVALSSALRLGLWPSRRDVERWCSTWRDRQADTTARLDSSKLAHETMVIAKWDALEQRAWLHEADTSPVEEDAAERARADLEREAWVASRMEALQRDAEAQARARVEAQARREYAGRRA